MAFTKLDNPKPGAPGAVGASQVRISAHAAAHESRYIKVQVGAEVARKGSFTHPEHKCDILVGDGPDAGAVAIALNDSGGAFKAKRQKNGSYKLTIGATAARGKFSLTFPPFTRDAKAMASSSGPAFITFDAAPDFLEQAFRKAA
jgi:hypothetical protein